MKIIDGLGINRKILSTLKSKISKLQKKPHLAIIQVGDNAASSVYIRQKMIFAERIGARVSLFKFSAKVSEKELAHEVSRINADKNIHGIIIQMPVPRGIDFGKLINLIDSKKDIDGLGNDNLAKLVRGESDAIVPATARGIFSILKSHKISLAGKNVVVVGRSVLVGKTSAMNLVNKDATVTICHRQTKNIEKVTKNADILIVATGVPGLIKKGHTNPKQVIIDVGINKIKDKLVGDVDPAVRVLAKTPVPGGVGPMTVASLFENLFDTFLKQI